MRQVRLGQTDLRVSAIAFGTWSFGDPHTPPEETAGALEELVAQGKIRHAGVSNYDVQQMNALRRFGSVETLQPPYHLFRWEIEHTILPYARQHDVGVLVYGPMAHGLLSGQLSESTTFAAHDWRSKSPDFTGDAYRRDLAVVARLTVLAHEWGITLPQMAVARTLANPRRPRRHRRCAPGRPTSTGPYRRPTSSSAKPTSTDRRGPRRRRTRAGPHPERM